MGEGNKSVGLSWTKTGLQWRQEQKAWTFSHGSRMSVRFALDKHFNPTCQPLRLHLQHGYGGNDCFMNLSLNGVRIWDAQKITTWHRSSITVTLPEKALKAGGGNELEFMFARG